MRPPPRAVADYDVDRAQVQRRRRQSRALLIARELLARVTHAPCRRAFVRAAPAALPAALCERCAPVRPVLGHGLIGGKAYPGGHCAGVPPLPIPNREVKPGCADGTAQQCGRVGGRRLFVDMVPVWPSGRTGTFFCGWERWESWEYWENCVQTAVTAFHRLSSNQVLFR